MMQKELLRTGYKEMSFFRFDDLRIDARKKAPDLDKETSLTGWNWFFSSKGIRLFSEIQQW